jgi:flagellar protein FliO/FliZ
MEFLFGEGQYGLRILVAIFLVLALIGVLAWLVRVFRSERTGAASRRGRQPPRLAVIDAAAVDGRRRLVLIRRDNVEHLLMIGGRADIVVEPNIVRATAREPTLARPPAFAEATQHPVPTQLEAAPAAFTPPRPTEAEPPVPRPTDLQPARERQLSGAAAETVFTPAAEQNSAEAAQRLVEAVLRRHRKARPDAE